MNNIFVTVIITAAQALLWRNRMALYPNGPGMFTIGLVPSATPPDANIASTHYISTGVVSQAIFNEMNAIPTPFNPVTISYNDPFVEMENLSLRINR